MYQRSFSLLSPQNSLLLVVDIQQRLMPVIENRDQIVFNTRRLLEAANLLEVPVLVSEQYPQGLGPTLPEIAEKWPASTMILPKKAFSVCAEDRLREAIATSSAPKIVLCGVEGHICVLQTAFDLLAMGKEVVLVVDAAGSRFRSDYETAIRRMESFGIVPATTEGIYFEWCSTSDHSKFKEISRLSKQTATDS